MSPPHLLITGCTGQVGHELAALDWQDWRVTRLSRVDIDLSNLDVVRHVVQRERPDILINAAAYTAVDRAETEAEQAFRINAEAPAMMAAELHLLRGLLIHFSTDYVFDGASRQPYLETDVAAPSGVYGASKLAGEAAIAATGCDHVILRTSWVYSHRGHNFLRTMLRLAAQRDELSVVADQYGTPTYARDLAAMTRQIALNAWAERCASHLGVFHLGNGGQTTWHGFAEEIMKRSGHQRVSVHPITTDQYPTPARRPAFSVLDKGRVIREHGIEISHWSEGLDRCLSNLAGVAE